MDYQQVEKKPNKEGSYLLKSCTFNEDNSDKRITRIRTQRRLPGYSFEHFVSNEVLSFFPSSQVSLTVGFLLNLIY